MLVVCILVIVFIGLVWSIIKLVKNKEIKSKAEDSDERAEKNNNPEIKLYKFRIVNPVYNGRIVFLDCETTGLDDKDRIIELAMVEVVANKKTGRNFHSYFKVRKRISEESYKIHGLTNEFLLDKPTFRSKSKEIIEFLRGAVVVAYNAPFDIRFINSELERIDPHLSLESLGCDVVCAMRFAEAHYDKWMKFDVLVNAYHLNIYSLRGESGRHSAKVDAELLPDVYSIIFKIFERRERSLMFPIVRKIKLMRNDGETDDVEVIYRNRYPDEFLAYAKNIHNMNDVEVLVTLVENFDNKKAIEFLGTYPKCRNALLENYIFSQKTAYSMKTWFLTYPKDISS